MSREDQNLPSREGFDPVWYLRTYSDVRAAGIDPWEHYDTIGRAEGRQGRPLLAMDLDHMLWRGFEDVAIDALETCLSQGSAKERAMAGWALARWYTDLGDTARARVCLEGFFAQTPQDRVPQHLGPFLLGIELNLACGDIEAALHILKQARKAHADCADLDLAAFLCARAQGTDRQGLSDHLSCIHKRIGLAPLTIMPGQEVLFDRIRAEAPETQVEDGPCVSVIMPIFNAAQTLERAVESVQAQTWRSLEILIIDDASDDDSLQIAHQLAARDARITVIAQPHNAGAYAARNVGLARATGAFYTVHDSDDWSHPEKIRVQVEALLTTPQASACVSHMVRASNDFDMTRWRIEDGWVYQNVSSLMMRMTVRDRLGYWDRVRVSADTEYYHRIRASDGANAIIEVLPGVPMMLARTGPGSLTGRPETHLRSLFTGLRRNYISAAQAWHALMGGLDGDAMPEDRSPLHIPQFPKERPFRTDEALVGEDRQPVSGPLEAIRAHPLFDARWYQMSNRDILFQDIDPARHYFETGARENRDPGPAFSTGGVRYAMGLSDEENPLLWWDAQQDLSVPALPSFEGSQPGPVQTLVFAHTATGTLFGAERSLIDVLRRMCDAGKTPVVVLPTLLDPGYIDLLRPVCAMIEVMPQLWRYAERAPDAVTIARAKALIAKHRPSEVHVNTLVLDAPLLAARQAGCKTVVHVRELPGQDAALCHTLGTNAERLRAQLLEQADEFIANSPLVAEWLGVPARTLVKPNSVDPSLFDITFNPGRQLTVALISSNVIKKGIDDFLDVARQAYAAGSTVRFLLIGPASQDLHTLRPWSPNVEFRGYASSPAEALKQADVVLNLSHFAESFGRTVLEAMAAGRPVICYDRGTPPAIVQSGVSGLVVPADDPAAVLRAVLALDAARMGLATMSKHARARASVLQSIAVSAS